MYNIMQQEHGTLLQKYLSFTLECENGSNTC